LFEDAAEESRAKGANFVEDVRKIGDAELDFDFAAGEHVESIARRQRLCGRLEMSLIDDRKMHWKSLRG
jgi:hypothetical protein